MGIGDSLRVDPERLSHLGNQMVDAATGLPSAPAAFIEAGAGPLSDAIRGKLPGIEDPIMEALPKLKAEATKTANNIVTAAGHYQRTDEQLAANYEAHQFDTAASSSGTGSGGSGGGSDAMGPLSQLMSMPMQMASQAAQLPSKALGALASAPQSVMQGVQQISSMAGGVGASGSGTSGSDASNVNAGQPQDGQNLQDEKDQDRQDERDKQDDKDKQDEKDRQDEKDKQDPQQGAASGDANGERAPVAMPSETSVQQQNPRRASHDSSIDL